MTVEELISILRGHNPAAIVEVSVGRWCAEASRVCAAATATTRIQPGGFLDSAKFEGAHPTVVIFDESSCLNPK